MEHITQSLHCTGLYTLAASVMALHFEIIVKKQGGCPVPMLVGDPETGM